MCDNIIHLPPPLKAEPFEVLAVSVRPDLSGLGHAHVLISHRDQRIYRVLRGHGWEVGEIVFVPYAGGHSLDWSSHHCVYDSNSPDL